MAWPGFCNPRPLGLDLALEEIRTRPVGGARVPVVIPPSHDPQPPQETHDPAFKNIAEAELLQTVREREQDASKINQAVSSLCGPASLIYLTAKYRPHQYSGFVIELYQTGTATLGSLKITPGKGCKEFNPAGKLAGADWVALAGVRDSENSILSYSNSSDEAAGITLPSTLVGWMEKAGFKDIKNETNLYITKGESNLREVPELRRKGYEVCLLIDAAVIQHGPASRGFFSQIFTIPNHWVTLTSDMTISADSVKFTVFSWGHKFWPVPPTKAEMDEQGFNESPPAGGWTLTLAQFLQNYYGYVASKP